MGFRFQKRINLGGGLRLNLSKSTIGISGGVRGARVSINSKGRRTTSVGIPGTGLYYRTDRTVSSRSTSIRGDRGPSVAHGPVEFWFPKVPLFASQEDKQFIRGVQAYCQDDYGGALKLLRPLASGDSAALRPGVWYLIACCLNASGQYAESVPILKSLLAALESTRAEIPDPQMERCRVSVPVYLSVHRKAGAFLARMSTLTAWLSLAESYAQSGSESEAIEAMGEVIKCGDSQQGIQWVEEMVGAKSFLQCLGWQACLLLGDDRYQEVIAITDGISNVDDVSLTMLLARGWALLLLGQVQAALTIGQDADRSVRRDEALRLEGAYLRGRCYEELGRTSMAVKEYQRVISVDSTLWDVAERLQFLLHGGGAQGSAPPNPSPPPPPRTRYVGREMVTCPSCRREKEKGRRCSHCGHRSG